MGRKNPLRHSFYFTPWVMQLGKDSGSGRGENVRSEHEQRPLFHFIPERSAPTVTLTAAVHVLTSLAIEYSSHEQNAKSVGISMVSGHGKIRKSLILYRKRRPNAV